MSGNAEVLVRTSGDDTLALARVGRFGPGSLSLRLLAVLLIPILGLEILAWREVQQQRSAADSAAVVRHEVQLLQRSGELVVPLFLEYTTTKAIAEAESNGSDRQTLPTAGVDLVGYITESRAKLDIALADLTATDGDVQLPGGTDVATAVAAAKKRLATVRSNFDQRKQTVVEIDAGYTPLIAMLTDLHERSDALLSAASITHELARVASETQQVYMLLTYATAELEAIEANGMAANPTEAVTNTVAAAGAFRMEVSEFRRMLTGDRQATFDALVSGSEFQLVEKSLQQYIDILTHPATANASDATVTAQALNLYTSSFIRLGRLQVYSDRFLADQTATAEAAHKQAENRRLISVIVMIASLVVSLVLLALVMRSILRPLTRLISTSRKVSAGDLAVAPEHPTGPSDIRVVTKAFNDMTATLRAYEQQLRRLASGDTRIDSHLPGPLGDSLRRSVSHLAEVTSQLHASEAAAVMQARTDSLTGLNNRAAALEELAVVTMQARNTDRTGAIVFLDLDGFKSVNDTQGHGEGDRVLHQIGLRLRDACPEYHVARIGGDEFIIIIPRAPALAEVTALAGRLIGVVSEPITGSGGQMFTLSASAGVAIIDGHADPLTVMAHADSAVYHAKELGRGRVELFDERLAQAIEERAEMALTMRQAIAQRQFELKLQPIIDVATRRPVGAEVLLRWNRPGLGEVGPTEFIPIAERTGVIIDLETWVLEEAVEILREWRIYPSTADMRLAVNISGRHIVDGNLAGLLDGLCTRANVDPGLLDLEITETHLVADIGGARGVVDSLRDQGFTIAIDDFGTGYSSMTYLHQLTVDTLKIDRVFVAGMIDDRLDRTIVELLLRLGDSLGLKVVAEGVDSEDKLALLAELRCPLAQGYYIARPMGVPEATQWLRQHVAVADSLA